MAEAYDYQQELVDSIEEQKVQREATRPRHDAKVAAFHASIAVAFSGERTGTGN